MTERRLVLFLTFIFILSGCGRDVMTNESRIAMGTIVNMKFPLSGQEDIRPAIAKSFSRIEEIEKIMNRFDENSEVSFINRSKTNEAIRLNPEMAFILRRSLELNRITDGAFDITVSPLIELWGFPEGRNDVPSDEEIARVLSAVGSENILLGEDETLSFIKDGIKIDLSGIAKGYAVDEAIKILKKEGIENGMIDAGGDIYCMGSGPDKKGWRVGIMHPRKKRLLGRITLKDRAVATSGDYQRFFFIGKRRYSHIIDPRNGYPVGESPMSVTVVADDCITADGLATAISVMGHIEGLRLAEGLEGIEAIVVSKDEDTLKIGMTSGIRDFYEGL